MSTLIVSNEERDLINRFMGTELTRYLTWSHIMPIVEKISVENTFSMSTWVAYPEEGGKRQVRCGMYNDTGWTHGDEGESLIQTVFKTIAAYLEYHEQHTTQFKPTT